MKPTKIKFKNRHKIIAIEGRKQVGYLNFEYVKDASYKRNIEISYMHVKPEYRKLGIGSKMIQFLISKISKKKTIVYISLWTGLEIETVKKTEFYLRNGFKKLAYQEDYYAKGIGTTLFSKRIN